MISTFFLNKYIWNNTVINRFKSDTNKKPLRENNLEEVFSKKYPDEDITSEDTAISEQKHINEINTCEELDDYINNYTECTLKNTCSKTVTGVGPTNSPVMFIGEAPGEEEDKTGIPFVGRSGMLLRKMIKYSNIDENKIYISNIIPWRPENNRTPNTEEIFMCLPFIKKRIELISPKYLILVGGVSAKSILNTNVPVTKLRGKVHEIEINNKIYLAIVTFHPSFLLRSPAYKVQAKEDMDFIRLRLQNDGIFSQMECLE